MGNSGGKGIKNRLLSQLLPRSNTDGRGREQEGSVPIVGSRREQEGSVPPTPSLPDAQKPPQCQPGGYSCTLLGVWGWFWALLFAPSFHGTYNAGQGMGGPAAKADVMLSLCHLWARSASISQKRREGGQNFPSPFGAGSPARTVMGKASRVGEASEREEPRLGQSTAQERSSRSVRHHQG